MALAIRIDNRIRHGSFDIAGIRGTIPVQAITSTNLNHAETACFDPDIFKTSVAINIEFEPRKLVRDSGYRERRMQTVSEAIRRYPQYLFLLALQGVKTNTARKIRGRIIQPFRFTRPINELLIAFQRKCGFPLTRVFFNCGDNVREDYRYYRKLVPEGEFVAALDENMRFRHFRWLYTECLNRGDEVVTFFGHNPSKNKRNLDNTENFKFLTERRTDKILRLSTSTEKSMNSTVSSIIHNFFGIDVCSFSTSRWRDPKMNIRVMKALDNFNYKPLLKGTTLKCAITGKNLYRSAQDFETSLGKPSIPISTHDIARLNEQFAVLHRTHTRESLRPIVDAAL